jgi:hypothetical protein
MAQNDQPDFGNIADAFNTLRIEVPRLNNLVANQHGELLQQILAQTQQILTQNQQNFAQIDQRFSQIDQRFAQITDQNQQVLSRLTALEIRYQNNEIRALNRVNQDRLQPLLDVQTGVIIPDCPNTVSAINNLSADVANQIVLALGIPVRPTATLEETRAAVRQALL